MACCWAHDQTSPPLLQAPWLPALWKRHHPRLRPGCRATRVKPRRPDLDAALAVLACWIREPPCWGGWLPLPAAAGTSNTLLLAAQRPGLPPGWWCPVLAADQSGAGGLAALSGCWPGCCLARAAPPERVIPKGYVNRSQPQEAAEAQTCRAIDQDAGAACPRRRSPRSSLRQETGAVEADLARVATGLLVLFGAGSSARPPLIRAHAQRMVGEVGRRNGSNGRLPQLPSAAEGVLRPRAATRWRTTPGILEAGAGGRPNAGNNGPASGRPGRPAWILVGWTGSAGQRKTEVFEALSPAGQAGWIPRASTM